MARQITAEQRERYNQKKREYYQTHKEQFRANKKEWAKNNPEKYREMRRRDNQRQKERRLREVFV